MNYTWITMLVLTLIVSSALAQIPSSNRTANDAHALNAIFEEQHLADDALAIHRRAVAMPAEERYDFLSGWVLPDSEHDTIRVSLAFTPTHPAPPVQDEDPRDRERLRIAAQAGQSRVQIGGRLVAPAIDLVEVAQGLGRLDDIRRRIAPFTPADSQQQRSKLALLILLDTEQVNFAAASENLHQLFLLVQTGTHSSFFERCPETIAIWAALRHPETRGIGREMLIPILDNQIRRNIDSGEPAWEVHIQALWGEANSSVQASGEEWEESFGMPPALQQWSGTDRVIAPSRGRGSPQAHWQISDGRVENLAIHSDDYLFFQSPLRGNFEVECDVLPFGWRDSTIYVAGEWVSPVYTLTTYKVGNVRGEQPRRALARKLVKPRDWFRYRAVVHDNVCSTYYDGLKINEEFLPAEYEPWLAIRSVLRNAGVTRGLRITGHPDIPEIVRLSALRDLPGWMPYSGGSVGSRSEWRQETAPFGRGGIVGRYQPEYAGTGQESLLYYVRPMLEDGEIEYEFFYRVGQSQTHPALDRLAFLIDRGGVRIHWITDGKYDRTGLDPMNVTVEPQNRRGPAELPLKDNNWNRLKISLAGNTVHLILNRQEVYVRELEATNQRTFGLFHYAGQTEARVRNILWKGDWPRALPTIERQELAGEGTGFLDDDLPKLPAAFEHDFARSGLPDNRFTVFEDGWQNSVVAQPDGVHVTRFGQAGRYLNYSIAPRLTIKGDFDVMATFRNFEPMPEAGSEETKCSLILSAALNDPTQTSSYLYRRYVKAPGREDDRLVQGALTQTLEGQLRRNYFGTICFEAESGTLRLARRGNKLYYLVAEHDSSYFRLIGEETVSDADLFPEGIRLQTQVAGEGTCSVVWTNLAIRAEEIIDPVTEQRRDQAIADLERQLTGELPASALEFDGRTQYVSVPSIRYDGSSPITLEVYVTHDRTGSVVIGDTQQSGFALGVPSTYYNMHAWNGTSYSSAISDEPAPTNVRVHLAGTFDGQTLTLFVNGKLLRTTPLNGVFVPSGFPLTIGASPSPREAGIDYAFAGLIDEVRISKSVRYTTDFEPAAKFETDADTLALYHFDEGQGETLTDSSGNQHPGIIHGAKWVNDSAIRHRAALGLVPFGSLAVGGLTEALQHQNPDVRFEAATALGLIGTDAKPAVSALKQLSEDSDQRVSTAARQSLLNIEQSQLIDSVRDLLNPR